MSKNGSLSNGAGERLDQVLALFVKNPELLAFCSQHQDQPVEVKAKVKEFVADVTVEDIQGALKKYAQQRISVRTPDHNLEKLRTGLQKGLLEVVEQIDRGYRITMWMYTAAFIMGLVMLATSMITALLRENHSAVLLGGLGAADVITFLIFKPAQDLQASRGGLAQLQAAFFAWINDIHNWNDYLELLQNEAGTGAPPFEKCKQISEIQGRSTELMARLISMHTRAAPDITKPRRQGRTGKTASAAKPSSTG
jgi:hypothetical protein